MQRIKTTFDQLIFDAGEVLECKLLRTNSTVKWYKRYWRRVHRQLLAKGVKEFTADIGRQYLIDNYGELDYATLSKTNKDVIKIVTVLCEYCETGTIRSTKERIGLNGYNRALMQEFIIHQGSFRLKASTLNEREHYASRFLFFLQELELNSFDKIDQLVIFQYLKTLDSRFTSVTHMSLRAIRFFLNYLFVTNVTLEDKSFLVPKDNYKRQAKLPSTFSKEEIEQMIGTINRSSKIGKRNYAIVLLAARLGIRASDITTLKFSNILWEKSIIAFSQYKTGREIELPLLAEVGNSIIDYLKYARPISSQPYIFLTDRYPYQRMHTSGITNLVQKAFLLSGINVNKRHHGPHALRHSLASLLLEQRTILPVITEVLGHENSNSTKYYLRIDLKSMKQCILDVPPVSDEFYTQKGGCFYE